MILSSRKGRKVLDLFYKAIIIPKSDKSTGKEENCRPISITHIQANILSKALANQTQEHFKKTTSTMVDRLHPTKYN